MEKLMKTAYFKVLLVTLIIQVFIFGCSKPPTEEMIKAEKALEQAKQKEADIYALDIYNKIEETYKKAKELVSAKRYEDARTVANEVPQLAHQAISLAESNKLTLKTEAERTIEDVQGKIDEMKSMAPKMFKRGDAQRGKKLQEMIQKWETELADIENQLKARKIKYAFDELKVLIAEINAKEKISLSRREMGKLLRKN